MSQNSREITSLNWRALVDEAIRRRKAEMMTQRDHAALASVSIPTIVAFDRGERTLTLAKAFDILRVVGLVEEPSKVGSQEAFVQGAFARWRVLTSALPKDSPGRFPHGWYRIDYALEGDLKNVELHELRLILDRATVRHSGWPPFWVPHRKEIAPHEVDGTLECWLAPGESGLERALDDAAHCDFWRASPSGRMFLIRGYQEDTQETFAPSTIFDTTLPIWRLAEAMLHSASLSALLAQDPKGEIKIRFRVMYTGLNGRTLRAWSNPMSDLLEEGRPARSDEVMLETEMTASAIQENLVQYLLPMVSSLFERFGVTGASEAHVRGVVKRVKSSRF